MNHQPWPQNEADRTVEHAGLPDVVAPGARHRRDQARVDHHFEQHQDRGDDDGPEEAAAGDEGGVEKAPDPRKMLTEKNEYLKPSVVDQPFTRPLALRTKSVCSAGRGASVFVAIY